MRGAADVCLIHTGDLHNHLQAAQARRLRELKVARRGLLVDCGDALQSPNLVAFPWPEPIVEFMNQAGYDAMCMGNREYGFTRGALVGKTRRARFPVLAANLHLSGKASEHIQRWTIVRTADRVKVGLFGLTVPLVRPGSFWETFTPNRFVPVQQAAAEAVIALRAQVDILVALTHYGEADLSDLAEANPQLDAILAGHWHVDQPSLEMVAGVAVARSFHYAQGVGILTRRQGQWQQERECL